MSAEQTDIALVIGYFHLKTLGAKILPLFLAACLPRAGHRGLATLWSVGGFLGLWLYASKRDQYGTDLLVIAGALAYYIAACTALLPLEARIRSGLLKRDMLFCLLALAFVLLPAFVLRRFGAIELVLLGWRMTLSAYSYFVECKFQRDAKLREYLFFVVVDPTVVYSARSRPRMVPRRQVLARVIGGTCLMLLGGQIIANLHWARPLLGVLEQRTFSGSDYLLTALVVFFASYWVRSGSAHVRIGFMQTMGYQPPECFLRPYLATSPMDFWRRWNCWIGEWAKRYLFAPLSLRLLRTRAVRASAIGRALGLASAVLGSFAAMGLLHEGTVFCGEGTSNFGYFRLFLCAAIGLLFWEGICGNVSRRRSSHAPPSVWRNLPGRAFASVYIVAMMAAAGTI